MTHDLRDQLAAHAYVPPSAPDLLIEMVGLGWIEASATTLRYCHAGMEAPRPVESAERAREIIRANPNAPLFY